MVSVKRRRNPASVVESHPLAQLEDLAVRLEWDERTGSWMTFVPELNNIGTFGPTQEAALDSTVEMVLVYIETMLDEGCPLPLDRPAIQRVQMALR